VKVNVFCDKNNQYLFPLTCLPADLFVKVGGDLRDLRENFIFYI